MKGFAVLVVLLAGALPRTPARAQGADEGAVRAFIESFLTRLGDHRLDTLDADFTPKALIVVVRQRDGEWASTYQTAEEWLAVLKRNPGAASFREPLTNIVITIDSDRLAHVRADFQVIREGRALSSGVDHFTLVREAAGWKIAMVAYTSQPARD